MPFNPRAREDDEKRLALREPLSLSNYPLGALQKLAALRRGSTSPSQIVPGDGASRARVEAKKVVNADYLRNPPK